MPFTPGLAGVLAELAIMTSAAGKPTTRSSAYRTTIMSPGIPAMKGEGYCEWLRQRAEAIKEQHKPQPAKPAWAPG
jgi:hypothetical protein